MQRSAGPEPATCRSGWGTSWLAGQARAVAEFDGGSSRREDDVGQLSAICQAGASRQRCELFQRLVETGRTRHIKS